MGKVSKVADGELLDALVDGGFGEGGATLGEAGVEGDLGTGVGEEEMFDDLLGAPLAGGGGAELSLFGI